MFVFHCILYGTYTIAADYSLVSILLFNYLPMIKKIVLSLIAILGISFAAMAQKQVTGTVVDQSGAPVPGASVMVQGTNIGAVTDLDGHFTIKATDKDVLAFSFFGMKDEVVAVGSQSVINVTLAEDALKG